MKLNKKNLIIYFSLTIFCLVVFSFWQWSNNFADPDTFYHMKMGQLILDQGIITEFPWQQYTVLNDYFVDHHFLYHLILAPFVVFIKPLIGMKINIVLLSTAFILGFVFILQKMKLKGAPAMGLLLIVTIPLVFRLGLAKANALSLIILFLGLYCAYKYKFLWLFALSFLYVWAYGGFLILVGIVFLIAVIDFIQSRNSKKNLLLVATNLSGFLAGLIINPYFPKNLLFYWQQVVQIGIINYQDKIGVGGEWYPYGGVELLTGCSLLNVLIFLSLILFLVFIKKQNKLSWLGIILFAAGLLLVLKSRRYIEYYVPFAAFFAMTSLNASLKGLKRKSMEKYFVLFWQKNFINKISILILAVYTCLVVPVIVIKDFQNNNNDLRNGINYYEFENALSWLEENSNTGDIILHSDWDEWPQLFYYNHYNYYIVGLDPTFMYKYDEELYWLWVNITIGKQKDDLPNIIKNKFKAKYIIVEDSHISMNNNIKKFEKFELVYADDEAKIYQTKNLSP